MDAGHTVLAIPVPPLEAFVRSRTAHYDEAYLGAPDFGQAHVTLLAPWLRTPAEEDIARVASLVERTPAFAYELTGVATFPDGTIHLEVAPQEPFRELTSALRSAWPWLTPYEGRFGSEVAPHLTLDAEAGGVDAEAVRAMLPVTLPVRATAHQVQLQWWQAGSCHVQHAWSLSPQSDTQGAS